MGGDEIRPDRFAFEKEAIDMGYSRIAGVDEAGRGPLAGPVVAAACLFLDPLILDGIDDSKKLTPAEREFLFTELTTSPSVIWSVGIIDPKTIDEVNIYQATILAMTQAIEGLKIRPDYLLVDGMKLEVEGIDGKKIIKGDALSYTIGAASIIAKVTRDQMMESLDRKYPQYGFKKHKGYGTAFHRGAIEQYGPCEAHRMTFEPVKSWCATR